MLKFGSWAVDQLFGKLSGVWEDGTCADLVAGMLVGYFER